MLKHTGNKTHIEMPPSIFKLNNTCIYNWQLSLCNWLYLHSEPQLLDLGDFSEFPWLSVHLLPLLYTALLVFNIILVIFH